MAGCDEAVDDAGGEGEARHCAARDKVLGLSVVRYSWRLDVETRYGQGWILTGCVVGLIKTVPTCK